MIGFCSRESFAGRLTLSCFRKGRGIAGHACGHHGVCQGVRGAFCHKCNIMCWGMPDVIGDPEVSCTVMILSPAIHALNVAAWDAAHDMNCRIAPVRSERFECSKAICAVGFIVT